MTSPADLTWTSADGLTLAARDYAASSGPARLPVICIHGLTRNSRDFEVVAPRIAALGRRVLALDVRGRGRSAYDPNPLNYNPAVYAGDVIALMVQAGLSRAIFVGTSMGGLIAMTLAAMRPNLIGGVVLNDVGPEIGQAGLTRISSYVGGAPQVADWRQAADYARSTNGQALPNLGDADWDVFARRIFRQEASGALVLDYDPAISQAFKAAPTSAPATPAPDLWPLFVALTAGRPALLVRGETSDILDPAIAERMGLAAPHMNRADVAGVGHAPLLEEPVAESAIATFLQTAP